MLSALLLSVSLLGGLLLFRSRSDLYGYFAFLVPLSLIASPHALYYDAALLVVPCAWLMMRNPRWYTMPLAIAFLVTWLSPLWPQNFVHPVTLLCIGLAVLIVLESREQVT